MGLREGHGIKKYKLLLYEISYKYIYYNTKNIAIIL